MSVSFIILLQSELVALWVWCPAVSLGIPSSPSCVESPVCWPFTHFVVGACPPVILETGYVECKFFESLRVWICILPPYLTDSLAGYKTVGYKLFSLISLEDFFSYPFLLFVNLKPFWFVILCTLLFFPSESVESVSSVEILQYLLLWVYFHLGPLNEEVHVLSLLEIVLNYFYFLPCVFSFSLLYSGYLEKDLLERYSNLLMFLSISMPFYSTFREISLILSSNLLLMFSFLLLGFEFLRALIFYYISLLFGAYMPETFLRSLEIPVCSWLRSKEENTGNSEWMSSIWWFWAFVVG